MRMPAVREALPAGDFRDWPAIEAWAEEIARELRPATVAGV
jgi:menaquinone-dependent protoporphyrinogen oxidase